MTKWKRAAVFALATLLFAAPALAAVREDFVFTDAQSEAQNDFYFDSMAACGGCIYLHDYNNACVWRADPEAKNVAAFSEIISQEGEAHTRISVLAARSDSLYAPASRYRTDASGASYLGSGLYKFMPGGSALEPALICALDLSAYVTAIEGWGDELPPCAMALQDGALFCLFSSHSALLQISLADSSVRPIDVESPVYLSEYEGGRLLVSCQNPDGSQRLVTYDPARGETENLVDGVYPSVSGFVYREADRMLYAVSEGSVYRIDPHAERAKAERCGTLGHCDSMIGGADAGERLIWQSASEAVAAQMDAEAQEVRTLRYSVIGSVSSEVIEGFARAQGGLRMQSVSRTDREIIDDMLARSGAVDVYILNITESGAYRSLYRRGYLQPLSSESITEKRGEMYPLLQGLAMRDGEALALPISMTLTVNQLGVSAGQTAYVYASVTLLCVNPHSQNQALALDFLEYALESLSPLEGAQLFATAEAPIEDANYAALKREYEREVARRKAMIGAADGAERAALQEELARYVENGEAMLADARYIVTRESLSAFRARLDARVPYFTKTSAGTIRTA